MKKVIDFLRKLGIFRSGAISAKYTSAKNMPTEFLMDGVANAKKDLTTKEDLKKVKEKLKEVIGEKEEAKIKFFISWIFGLFFFIVGFFSFGSSFISGIFGILTGALIFPRTSSFLTTKIKILEQRKWKIIAIIISFLIFLFSSGEASREYSLEIKTGSDDPKEIVDFSKNLINLVDDFQEVQLQTVALLSVKFETADKEEYFNYSKDTKKKWSELEKETAELKKTKKTTFLISNQEKTEKIKIFKTANANQNGEIDFGDFHDNYYNQEISVGNKEGRVFQDIVQEAQAFKFLHPSETAIGYLEDHLEITVKEAYKKIEEFEDGAKKNWENKAKLYEIASNTATGIAFSSKVTLFAMGTVASFGTLAATQTGAGVAMAMTTGIGTALGGADIAIDIAEGASIIATGEGIVNYEKNKEMVGKLNTIFVLSNLPKTIAGGIPKFNGDQLQKADDFMTILGLGETTNNVFVEIKKDKLTISNQENIKNKAIPIEKLIGSVSRKEFQYQEIIKGGLEENSGKKEDSSKKQDFNEEDWMQGLLNDLGTIGEIQNEGKSHFCVCCAGGVCYPGDSIRADCEHKEGWYCQD